MIGVIALGKLVSEGVLSDNAANQYEIALVDYLAKLIYKIGLFRFIRKFERSNLLADIAFVKNHDIVAKPIEFELLDRRNDLLAVMAFIKYTEGRTKIG